MTEKNKLRIRSRETIKQSYVKDPSKMWDFTFDWYQVGKLLEEVFSLTLQDENLLIFMKLALEPPFLTDAKASTFFIF
jgi:hypothetical protein